MSETKQLTKIARLKNISTGNLVYKHDGIPYVFRPDEEKDLPIDIAAHFVGTHIVGLIDMASPDAEKDVEAEQQRILDYLPLTPEQRLAGGPLPLIMVEIIDPNNLPEVEQGPIELASSAVPEAPGETPFPTLTAERSPIKADEILTAAAKVKAEAKDKK